MSDPFLAEIRIVGFNYAPRSWATCDGQLLPIPQNTALYSLLGTTFGGDGRSTFALPNLQGRVPIAAGSGPGLSRRLSGDAGGETGVTLSTSQMPSHGHSLEARGVNANTLAASPSGAISKPPQAAFASGGSANTTLNAQSVGAAGSSGPHNNMQPYLTLLFCIALQGVFPQRP